MTAHCMGAIFSDACYRQALRCINYYLAQYEPHCMPSALMARYQPQVSAAFQAELKAIWLGLDETRQKALVTVLIGAALGETLANAPLDPNFNFKGFLTVIFSASSRRPRFASSVISFLMDVLADYRLSLAAELRDPLLLTSGQAQSMAPRLMQTKRPVSGVLEQTLSQISAEQGPEIAVLKAKHLLQVLFPLHMISPWLGPIRRRAFAERFSKLTALKTVTTQEDMQSLFKDYFTLTHRFAARDPNWHTVFLQNLIKRQAELLHYQLVLRLLRDVILSLSRLIYQVPLDGLFRDPYPWALSFYWLIYRNRVYQGFKKILKPCSRALKLLREMAQLNRRSLGALLEFISFMLTMGVLQQVGHLLVGCLLGASFQAPLLLTLTGFYISAYLGSFCSAWLGTHLPQVWQGGLQTSFPLSVSGQSLLQSDARLYQQFFIFEETQLRAQIQNTQGQTQVMALLHLKSQLPQIWQDLQTELKNFTPLIQWIYQREALDAERLLRVQQQLTISYDTAATLLVFHEQQGSQLKSSELRLIAAERANAGIYRLFKNQRDLITHSKARQTILALAQARPI